jgi:hypothetical protein
MQAFALTVIDFDHDKIGSLYDELQSRGLAVSVATVAQDEATGTPSTVTSDAANAAAEQSPAESAAAPAVVQAGPPTDEAAPFKCPGCGATYPDQVTCTNQHEPIETQPTADVIAAPAEEPETVTEPAAAVAQPAEPAPGTGEPPAPATPDPAEPDWPQ